MQLQELKRELERCQSELKQHQRLHEEREGELAKIQALKKNVEADLNQLYRLQDVYPPKAAALKQRIDEQTGHIAHLKKYLKEIDAQLDRLGEEKEAAVAQLKQNLFDEIQKHFPDSAAEYRAAETRLKETNQRCSQLTEQQQLLLPLHAILQQGAQIKPKAHFFDFLLGKHPTALLARTIHQATVLAEKILPRIQDERFKLYLEKFLKETKQPSNRSLYQGRFSELVAEFSGLMSTLDATIAQLQREVLSQEQTLESWVAQHCC